jgi:transcriptional regulator with XRE-family HTH domain
VSSPLTDSGADDDSVDPGTARAGAAAAARRRELDISQRRLAAEGVITAAALIAFEKGRSWPRERTREKLEAVLQWPTGSIDRLRRGEPLVPAAPPGTADANAELPLIVQALATAAGSLSSVCESLPAPDDAQFTPRATAVLSDLRQLEAVASRAARIGSITPALIGALATIRRKYDELMVLAASAPTATLGQRLYAARRRASLTIEEAAQAVGVPEDAVVRAESDQPLSAADADALQAGLIRLAWE